MWSCRNWRRKMSKSCQRKCCCFWTEAVREHFWPVTFLILHRSFQSADVVTHCLLPPPRWSCVYVQTHPARSTRGAQVPAGCFRQPRDGGHLLPHWHDGDDWHRGSTNIWPFTWRQGENWTRRTATDCSRSFKGIVSHLVKHCFLLQKLSLESINWLKNLSWKEE